MRLCTQVPGGEKYGTSILPSYNDMMAKKAALKAAKKNVNSALDSVILFDTGLDDILRDVQGKAEAYDRKHPGSNTATLIFPNGNITPIITMPNEDEPEAAHGIAQKIQSLGAEHELYPNAALIEAAVVKCQTALKGRIDATTAHGEADTALYISKIMLVRKYNANYFVAANDVDKNFAEKLFPKLDPPKKKKGGTDTTNPPK
jgi:hypothetical protein